MYEEASVDDLHRILVDSVIMYKKVPILVKNISLLRELHIEYVGQKKEDRIPLSSPELDFKPVSLGMCNHNGYSYYLTRRPARQWSQGLTLENLSITFLKNEGDLRDMRKLNNKSIYSCIMGDYPSLDSCITHLEKPEISEMAFSREWALDNGLSLYHRAERVGMINSDNGKPIFEKHKKFLKEILDARA